MNKAQVTEMNEYSRRVYPDRIIVSVSNTIKYEHQLKRDNGTGRLHGFNESGDSVFITYGYPDTEKFATVWVSFNRGMTRILYADSVADAMRIAQDRIYKARSKHSIIRKPRKAAAV